MELAGPTSAEFVAGDDRVLAFTVTQDGQAVDVSTGFTFKFALSRKPGGTVIIGTEISPANAVGAPKAGTSNAFEISIGAAATAGLRGTYAFQALAEGGGVRSTVLHGWFSFRGMSL